MSEKIVISIDRGLDEPVYTKEGLAAYRAKLERKSKSTSKKPSQFIKNDGEVVFINGSSTQKTGDDHTTNN